MGRGENTKTAGCGQLQGSIDTAKEEDEGRGGGDIKRYRKITAQQVHPDDEGGGSSSNCEGNIREARNRHWSGMLQEVASGSDSWKSVPVSRLLSKNEDAARFEKVKNCSGFIIQKYCSGPRRCGHHCAVNVSNVKPLKNLSRDFIS